MRINKGDLAHSPTLESDQVKLVRICPKYVTHWLSKHKKYKVQILRTKHFYETISFISWDYDYEMIR